MTTTMTSTVMQTVANLTISHVSFRLVDRRSVVVKMPFIQCNVIHAISIAVNR